MKLDVKTKIEELKLFFNKLDKKRKILCAVIAVLILAGAIATALILNHKECVPLFSDLSDEEAAEIVTKLQDQGVEYQYKGGGDILVDKTQADAVRAELVYEGYPKSGFTYDVFTNNAGGMTTDTEKQTYKLYDLQNRIGATIGLFDGVKDAKVTIALADEQKYVLEDDSQNKGASASVVVTMKNGDELSEKQAKAIQRLVAKSVPDMAMEDVAVFDENGVDLTSDSETDSSGSTEAELSAIVEKKIEEKVANILTPFYGAGNVRVSAHGKINMDKIIRETTTYETPDKQNENDKTGIVSKEQTSESKSTGNGTSGTAGTDSNADVTEYNQQNGTGTDTSESNSYNREYLVNSVKEQTEIDPGVMDDLTVSVSVNGDNFGSLSKADVKQLVANATGIGLDQVDQKITAVAAPFYTIQEPEPTTAKAQGILQEYWWAVAAIGAVVVLFVLSSIIRAVLKKKKRQDTDILEEVPMSFERTQTQEEQEDGIDILSIQNEKSRELRESVRDFAENNPEISAQMLRSWLNGGDQDGRK